MYIAIDVGGSKTRLGLFDSAGNLGTEVAFSTDKDPEVFMADLFRHLPKLKGYKKAKTVGLALPCSFNADGSIAAAGNLEWANVNITSQIAAKLKLPVVAENDANLGALAEANLGAGVGYKTVLYVTLSTGVGTGIIVDGKLRPELERSEGGQMVISADHHVLKRLEDLVSGPGFKERFGHSGFEVDDPAIWQSFAKDLAVGLFDMITLLGPDAVVLGGGMAMHFEAFYHFLMDYLKQINPGLYSLPPIKKAKYVETAVLYGAYLLAKSK